MNLAQKEALINEYKGNLFEFLLAKRLASYYGLNSLFDANLTPELQKRLGSYEDALRSLAPSLLRYLPELSESVFQRLLPLLPRVAERIDLVGKFNDYEENKTEADIIIQGEIPFSISLKLCKENAFVNTKSAGVRSFIEKYFSDFSSAKEEQRILNEKIDKDFFKMAHRLYEKAGLEFYGSFDSSWTTSGNSELPGELASEYSEIVLDYYGDLADFLREILLSYFQESPEKFKRALLSLCGFSKEGIFQVICFHGKEEAEKYQMKEILIHSSEAFEKELDELEFLVTAKQKSAFELKLKGHLLQIRCKPMNKFTVPALKINCSLKKV